MEWLKGLSDNTLTAVWRELNNPEPWVAANKPQGNPEASSARVAIERIMGERTLRRGTTSPQGYKIPMKPEWQDKPPPLPATQDKPQG